MKKHKKEDFGYDETMWNWFLQTHTELPKGTFLILKRKQHYYWYYQLSNPQRGRLKYICPTFEGTNKEGSNSFQVCLIKLTEKYKTNFQPLTNDTTQLSTLIDEYVGVILEEEYSKEGRKMETTRSIRNGCRKWKEFCLMKKITLRDVKDSKKIKELLKNYVDICKNRELKRGTIRTYLKHIRGFLNWLSDEDGKDLVKTNPITSKYISKIYPPNRIEKGGIGSRNPYYKDEYYDKMFNTCVHRVGELWNNICKEGWTKTHNNQPLGVGSDVVYFVSLFQLTGGFRLGEVLCSYRNINDWDKREYKKNSSSYWEKRNGVWFLYIDNYKGVSGSVPIELKIRSWVKPPNWKGKPTKVDKNGKPLYWDTPLVEVCMEMFRTSPFLFSSPNLHSKTGGHYGKTYYSNLFKMRLVSKGVGGEGWEGFGIHSSHYLRDYFITHGIHNGTSIEDLSQITRHLPTTLWKYYMMYSEEHQLKRKRELDKGVVIGKRGDVMMEDKN
jgi:hypothetical protein